MTTHNLKDILINLLYLMRYYTLGIIHLWLPQKMTNFLTLPYPHHPQKWTIDLLFKNNRIRKHVTNFKTLPPPFRVDVINVWSPISFEAKLKSRKLWSKKMHALTFWQFVSCNLVNLIVMMMNSQLAHQFSERLEWNNKKKV